MCSKVLNSGCIFYKCNKMPQQQYSLVQLYFTTISACVTIIFYTFFAFFIVLLCFLRTIIYSTYKQLDINKTYYEL